MSRLRQAVIVAGGKGTRLGSLTERTPKPLLDVAGRPFLEWILMNLERQGIEEVVLTIGYRSEAFDAWLSARAGRMRVSTFVERSPLDTGGALVEMIDRLDETFAVLNGDTLFDVSLQELLEALDENDAQAAVSLRRLSDTGRYGRAELSGSIVTGFAEKAGGGEGLVNGGVYVFRRGVLAGRGAPLSIERDVLPACVEARRLSGLPSDGFFIDIGVPETFEEAQRSVPEWWATAGDGPDGS